MKWMLSIGTPLMESEDQYRYLKWAKQAGFDAVECEIAHPHDPKVRKILAEGLNRYDIGFSGIRSGISYVLEGLCMSSPDKDIRNAAVERLIACNELVALYPGALNLIGMMQGVIKDLGRYEQARGYLVECMKIICKSAEELSIQVSIEPVNHMIVNYHNTVDEISSLIDDVGSPALGMLIDSYHMHMEEKDIVDAVLKAGDKVNHVHVADSNRQYPGVCAIDFPAFFRALDVIEYEGWITVETLEKPDFQTMAIRAMKYLKECGL